MPTVSIILPTLNRAHLLPRALTSVLNQDFTDFELIIIDDGSTDNTKNVVTEYAKNDTRIRYIRYEKNQGIPIVRNRGLSEAKGNLIAWQDDDDEWLPGKLKKSIDKMNSLPHDFGIVYTGYWRIRPNGARLYYPPRWVIPTEGDLYRIFLKKNFLPLQAMLFKKKVFETVGPFPPDFPGIAEYYWFPKMAKKYKFGYVPEPLVILYNTPGSDSYKFAENAKARLLFVQENYADLKKYDFLAYHYGVIADLYSEAGKPWSSVKPLLAAIRNKPTKSIYWAKLLFSIFGIHYVMVRKKLKPFLKRKIFTV